MMEAPDFLWNYKCNLKGCCCRGWKIGFREHDYRRLAAAAEGTELAPLVPKAIAVSRPGPFVGLLPPQTGIRRYSQEYAVVIPQASGDCGFLGDDRGCRVHATLGEAMLPEICRNFPIGGLARPDGVETFWELICPEVARTLATATRPAALTQAPADFARAVIAFSPDEPLTDVKLTPAARVPFAAWDTFRREAIALLQADPQHPLRVFARISDHVERWARDGATARPLRDHVLGARTVERHDRHMVSLLQAWSGRLDHIRQRLRLARQFLVHHPWGTAHTLDVLEAQPLPPLPDLARALEAVDDAGHLVLTNYLALRLAAVPLHGNTNLLAGWRGVVESVSLALLFAGAFIHASATMAGAEGMTTALALSDLVRRDARDAADGFPFAGEEVSLSAEASGGRVSDLALLLGRLARLRVSAEPFASPVDATRAILDATRLRLRAAFELHARALKAALRTEPRDAAALDDPWSPAPPARHHPLAQEALDAEATLLERLALTPDAPEAQVLSRLALSPAESRVVLALLSLACDTDLARAAAHVTLDYADPRPTGAGLAAMLGASVWPELEALGRLRRLGVTEVVEPGAAAPTTRHTLAPDVLAAALGAPPPAPAELAPLLLRAGQSARLVPPPEVVLAPLRDALRAAANREVALLLLGPDGHDRAELARLAGGRPVCHVNLEHVPDAQLGPIVRHAVRHALLTASQLLLTLGGQSLDALRLQDLREALALARQPILVAAHKRPAALLGPIPAEEVRVPAVPEAWRHALIGRALPRAILIDDAVAVRQAVTSLPAPPERLLAAAREAAATAQLAASDRDRRPKLSPSRLIEALRVQMATRIGDYAEPLVTTASWDDLQLKDEQRERLRGIVAAWRHRDKVLVAWGFGDKASRGNGITALLYGPPGTGKTMAAGVLGRELGLEVFRVDLARVVDKYIGETEKRLAVLFDEAERGEVLLLFDEADSLFGKRTAVKSATDRYANLEVNYLLQRIESYRGLVVLTTNHDELLDEAFRRRLNHHVHFAMPDAAERARIWRSLIPRAAPLEADVDFEDLGQRFEMSGGHIKNAVLTAAILAARDGTGLSMRACVRGANREYRALGKVVREEEES